MANQTSRRWRWFFGCLALVVLFGIRPARSHYRAAKVLQALSSGSEPNVTSQLLIEPALRYRLYGTPTKGQGIVLVHGVHEAGIEEPRLVHFARSLAEQGFVVMTPELTDLTHYHTPIVAADTIKRAVVRLDELNGREKVSIVGISFGGGLSLVAAADKQVASHLRAVVTLGAPADYVRIERFFATNEEVWPDGHHAHLQAHGYGTLVFALQNARDIFAAADAAVAEEVLAARLKHDAASEAAGLLKLTEPGRTTMTRYLASDTSAATPQMLDVIARHERALHETSPEHFADAIQVPVYVLHSAGDTLIPPAESAWLAHDLPQVRATLVSDALGHASVDKHLGLRELWPLIHFLSNALDE